MIRLKKLYEKVVNYVGPQTNEEGILSVVYENVRNCMIPDPTLKRILEFVEGYGRYPIIKLGDFINREAACLLYALTCASILKQLINSGYLQGEVSIEIKKRKNRSCLVCIFKS
jgi:hypothetical protein